MGLPSNLIEQFRAVALERLDRIEAGWERVLNKLDESAASALHRELHTLKGESRLVGFSDVDLVCHKLEDLMDVARARGYAVDEDFDLVVNMALRFMAMLVRKRSGTNLGGFDLPGFVSQIDTLLADTRRETGKIRTSSSSIPLDKARSAMQVSAAVRDRMGSAAVDAFIEYSAARGQRRSRLRTSWHLMREMIGIQRAVVSAEQLAKHRQHAITLARDLGKSVAVTLAVEASEVTSEVLAAIDATVIHLIRNAIDHGIESRETRVAAGKPPDGRIRIGGQVRDGMFELVVEDDGRGIDFERVQARAVELGLVTEPAELDRDAWIGVMCQPGFSTRTVAGDVSGRGVGLDAARIAATEQGGTLTATSIDGQGTTWRATYRVPDLTVQGYILRAPNVPFPIMLDEGWRPVNDRLGTTVVDLATTLGLADASSGITATFVRDGEAPITFLCNTVTGPVAGRRVVLTPSNTLGSVVVYNTTEALMIRPERLFDL